jgi:hypothetical protein
MILPSHWKVQVLANCEGCPRDNCGKKVVFNRNHLSNIERIIITQEPSYDIFKIPDIETDLIERCKEAGKLRHNDVIKAIIDFAHQEELYNPETSKTYWTHSIKCTPSNEILKNDQIKKDWNLCSVQCIKNMKIELQQILTSTNSPKIEIVAIGRYALAMCNSIFGCNYRPNLENPSGIKRYIKEIPDGRIIDKYAIMDEKVLIDKPIILRSMIHPAYADCHKI